MRLKKTSYTSAADQSWLSRRTFLKEMGLASVGCALFLSPWNLSAWNILKGNGTRIETIKETKTMNLAQQSTAPDRAIPPIDAAAPAITETATFAMG
jgi:hypothetical protein